MGTFIFQFFNLRSSSSRPMRACFICSSRRNDLMRERAFDVTHELSQSALGVWFFCVTTSTMSPLRSTSRMGTARLFTLPPVHVEPRLECMSNAKSSTVAPSGNLRMSPLGVNTNISPDEGFASKRCESEWVVSSNASRRRLSHCSLVCPP